MIVRTKSRVRIFAPHAQAQAALDEVRERERRGEIPRPGFDFPTIFRGSAKHFNVFFDPYLGAAGASHAEALLAVCDRDYSIIQSFFSGITPSRAPFNVIIAPSDDPPRGVRGAYHHGCDGIDIYCEDSSNIDYIKMLVVAEVVEVFSAAQGLGWDCSTTNGEALSRVLAEVLYPAEAIVIASEWLNSDRPDYITENKPSPLPDGRLADSDQVSNACGVLFLYWLHDQLGFSWEQIVQAGASSLGRTYAKLTGQTDAFARFSSFMQTHFPAGTPVNLPTNNPFPLPEQQPFEALVPLFLSILIAPQQSLQIIAALLLPTLMAPQQQQAVPQQQAAQSAQQQSVPRQPSQEIALLLLFTLAAQQRPVQQQPMQMIAPLLLSMLMAPRQQAVQQQPEQQAAQQQPMQAIASLLQSTMMAQQQSVQQQPMQTASSLLLPALMALQLPLHTIMPLFQPTSMIQQQPVQPQSSRTVALLLLSTLLMQRQQQPSQGQQQDQEKKQDQG
jgi:hypothetical protein